MDVDNFEVYTSLYILILLYFYYQIILATGFEFFISLSSFIFVIYSIVKHSAKFDPIAFRLNFYFLVKIFVINYIKTWDAISSGSDICEFKYCLHSDCSWTESLFLSVSFLKYLFIVWKIRNLPSLYFYPLLNLFQQTHHTLLETHHTLLETYHT